MAKKTTRKTLSSPKTSGGEDGKAEQHFKKGLLTRGEAVEKKTSTQKIAAGATHWIVGEDNKRVRFSL